MAEWLRRGLQILAPRFDSGRGLQTSNLWASNLWFVRAGRISMIDFDKARETMVDCQIRPNDVTDYRVLKAFLEIPRERFVGSAERALAYIDEDLPVSSSNGRRFLMEVMSLSKLVQLAGIDSGCIVLDIGCATGYSTAIISKLCDSVVALESDEELATFAGAALTDLGCDNAVVVSGNLESGYAKEGPYDVVFVGGAVDFVPEGLLAQLKDGGRLVVVEGHGNAGVAKLYTRVGDVTSANVAFNCAVKSLPGFQAKAEFVF